MNFFSLFKRNLIFKFKKKKNIDNHSINTNSLDELFNIYGSDKANHFLKNENNQGHGYSTFYSKELEEIKNKKIHVLEIGSYSGASAAAFVKYFKNAKVFCFDINISNFDYKSKHIEVYGLDIKNQKKIENVLKNIFKQNQFKEFDLIIDDGSHNLSDILLSLKYFFVFLKKNGLYVIEDYKFPNYYKYNRDVEDILIDELLQKLELKNIFKSSILGIESQKFLMENIKKINTYKGNLTDSDICFIKKK